MKNLILYIFFFGMTLSSCKKIIEIDVDNAESQIVIEGKLIDKFVAQQIKISRSVAYSDQNIFPPVTGAKVTVSDDRGNTYNFTEGEPGLYAYGMRGTPGTTYTMRVKIGDKSYLANSKMPSTVKLDSIGVLSNTFFGNERKTAVAFFTDPAATADFYHFNLYVNNAISNRVYISNDRLTNGNKLRYQLYYEKNDDDNEGLVTGDKIVVEMESVDANVFNYWYALSQQSGRGPNQGTTPSNPTSNISDGALGYFSAHTYQKIDLTVP